LGHLMLNSSLIFISFFSLILLSTTAYYRGVNLFGGWQGLYGGVSVFGTNEDLDYFKSKGLNTFRVGFAWEQLQPTLYGNFNPTYLALMDDFASRCKARGLRFSWVPLPGSWKGNQVGSSAVPTEAFYDMWTKVATHYMSETALWGYDLLNEPNMGDIWNTNYGPGAILAIRKVDMNHPIIVPTSCGGYGHYWKYHTAGLPMHDPANKLIYQAHFYFDNPPNGQYQNGYDAYPTIGPDHAADFVNWCKNNTQTCYVGEYGIPGGWTSGNETCTFGPCSNDPRWNVVIDNFLEYLDQNQISATYWAGGPYGDINDIGPTCAGCDRPQMAILVKHLGN